MGITKSFQITNVFPLLTAQENVRVALQALHSRFDIWRPRSRLPGLEDQAGALLETVGLWRRRERQAAELAHGEQRSLEIAMALAADPRLLLLDEPTAGMSPEETRAVMDLITRLARERTVILVEHKMKLVMGISDRLVVLHQGETLAEGTPDEIRRNETVRRVYLGPGTALMLEVRGLNSWYGRSHILQGIDLEVRRGEIVCLVGRNGAGKTTTLRSVMGLVPRCEGTVTFEGRDLLRLPAHARNGLGLGYVPEERRIVQGLSVRENLRLGLLASHARRREREVIEEVARVFPRLGRAARPGGRYHVGRRAADAGDRAGDGVAAEADHAGRAERGDHAGAGRRDVRAVPADARAGHDDPAG